MTYGQRKHGEQSNKYVHTLNSTLTATERTLLCSGDIPERGWCSDSEGAATIYGWNRLPSIQKNSGWVVAYVQKKKKETRW